MVQALVWISSYIVSNLAVDIWNLLAWVKWGWKMVKVNNLPHTTQASTSGLVVRALGWIACLIGSNPASYCWKYFALKLRLKFGKVNNLPPSTQAWTSGLVVQALAWITSLIGSNLVVKAVAADFLAGN